MKIYRIPFLFLLVFTGLQLQAQKVKQIKQGDVIVLTTPVKTITDTIKRISSTVDTLNDVTYLAKGVQFNVLLIDVDNKKVELLAVNFSDYTNFLYTKRQDDRNDLHQDQYNGKIYTISLKDFKRFAEYYEPIINPSRLSLGILTLPFKARVTQDNVSFDTELNFNSTVNVYINSFYDTHFSLQFGAGLGAINLNESNTTYKGVGAIQAQDVRTLTLLIGAMLSHKNVQIGIYAGWDHINNQENFVWDSNGKLWLGLGIGINVFNDSKETVATQSGI
jgi:hypothetical protein